MKGRWMLAGVMLCTLASLALGRMHPFGDPHSATGAGMQDRNALLSDADMPADARAVLIARCADCHSQATRWPPYARLGPGSWLIERDVVEGRRHMDLSQWSQLTVEDRQVLESRILRETMRGTMPPLQYRVLHWTAGLTAHDLQALALFGKEGGAAEAGTGTPGDADRGKAVFAKRCTGCHAMDADREGPRLRGVFGRKAGTLHGFNYSGALRASGITWNEDSLEKWLTDTDAFVPNNDMNFRVIKAAERADLVAYLKQQK